MSRPARTARPSRRSAAVAASSSLLASSSPSLKAAAPSPSPPGLNGFSISDSEKDEDGARPAKRLKDKEDRAQDGEAGSSRHDGKQDKLAVKKQQTAAAASNHSNGIAHKHKDLAPAAAIKRKTAASLAAPSSMSASSKTAKAGGKDGAGSRAKASSSALSPSSSPSYDPVTGEALYCICRLPNTGEAMICCEVCEEWYHFRCIAMTAQEASRITHYECARCSKDPARGREESRKRKREDDERRGRGFGMNGSGAASTASGDKRVRRRDKNGTEDAGKDGRADDDDGGDGTGKWIKKDAAVYSESDDDDFVYMTSDDDDAHTAPIKQEPPTVKTEEAKEDDSTAASITADTSAAPVTSYRAHHSKQPRTSSFVPSFHRPDYRLHPDIRHAARLPVPPHVSPSQLIALSRRYQSMLHALLRHPLLARLSSSDRLMEPPSSLPRSLHRYVQRWCALLTEYDSEERQRQMQLAADEWRLHRLIRDHQCGPPSLTVDDASFTPQQSPLDLFLSSALPVGLGHPRFLPDTQLIVNGANDFSSSVDAFHSHPHTPAHQQPSSATPAASSRSTFRFAASKLGRQTADTVCIESVWCVGCEGYIPTMDYVPHVEDCSATAMTTPDQRLAVLVPYEAGEEEEMVPGLIWREEWERERAGRKRRRDHDAAQHDEQERRDEESRRTAALERVWRAPRTEPDDKSSDNPTASSAPAVTTVAVSPASTASPSPPAAPVPAWSTAAAVVASPRAAAAASTASSIPAPVLSAAPFPELIATFHRFLPPALFPELLCGYPLLTALAESPSSPPYTHCLETRVSCPDHQGWEATWRHERLRKRTALAGKMRTLGDDVAAALAWLDKEATARGETAHDKATSVHGVNGGAALYDGSDSEETDEDDYGGRRRRTADDSRADRGSPEQSTDDSDDSQDDDSGEGGGLLSLGGGAGGAGLNGAAGVTKKEQDRQRVRERERLNKQRQRERAKAREREKEVRQREKERMREKKRDKKQRRKDKERRDRRRDSHKDRDRDRERSAKKRRSAQPGSAGGGRKERGRALDSASSDDESDSLSSDYSSAAGDASSSDDF